LQFVTWAGFAALLGAAVLAVVGCAGGGAASAQEVEDEVVAARDRVDFVLAEVTRAQSKDEFLERMDDAAAVIDDAANDLDALEPRDQYAPGVDRLAASFAQLAFDVQATADQVREPGFGGLLEGVRGLSFESWNEANRALAALRRSGIDVGQLERH
jgi:hypothetical protein